MIYGPHRAIQLVREVVHQLGMERLRVRRPESPLPRARSVSLAQPRRHLLPPAAGDWHIASLLRQWVVAIASRDATAERTSGVQ